MPIETDNSHHDFVWRFSPTNDDQQSVFFSIRLHKTAEYGWTLSFLNDENQIEGSFPADMFSEISEHISAYIRPAETIKTPMALGKPRLGVPQIGRAGSTKPPAARPASRTVPSPSFANQQQAARTASATAPKIKASLADGASKEFEAPPVNIDEEFNEQEGVFLPEGHSIEDVQSEDGDPVFQSFAIIPDKSSSVRPIVQEIDPEEQNRILQERQKAANNPGLKTGIKKRHSN